MQLPKGRPPRISTENQRIHQSCAAMKTLLRDNDVFLLKEVIDF